MNDVDLIVDDSIPDLWVLMTTCINDDGLCVIHIPKCGGTSLFDDRGNGKSGWLMDNLKQEPRKPGPAMSSLSLSQVCHAKATLPEDYRLIIAIVRNPYERAVSSYYGRKQKGLMREFKTLASYIRHPISSNIVGGPTFNLDPTDYYLWWVTVDGNKVPPNVKFVRLEEIDAVLPSVLAPYLVDNPTPIRRVNTSKHKPVDELMDDDDCKVIEKRFQWTFENLYKLRTRTIESIESSSPRLYPSTP